MQKHCITDFVKEGLHIQATTIESVDRIGRYEGKQVSTN